MFYTVTYKDCAYHAEAPDFVAAQNDLENSIGRPLPNGSEIRNETTGEAYIIRWGNQEQESPSKFVRRVNGTGAEQMGALQCDLFRVNT